MAAAPVDLSGYTPDELTALAAQVQNEQAKRAILANAPSLISAINTQVLTAQGVADGSAWVQPTGASDAYPIGWNVTHNGVPYQSLIAANTTTPGDPNDPQNYRWWKNMTPPPPPSTIPAWDGNGVAYAVGDKVTYSGGTYQCLQAHTSQPGWDPVSTPALWQAVAAS